MRVLGGGIVHRNPEPEVRAHHAWHPTIVRFDDGELVCAFEAGEADQATDYRGYITRSTDLGATWSVPVRAVPDHGDRPMVQLLKVSRVTDGLVGVGARVYRDDPDVGIINTPGLGYAEMDLFLVRSSDRGRTWSEPEPIEPPFVGPSWEACHGVVELRDGRWLLPIATWMGWNGEAPNGMCAVAFVSEDRGRTWPRALVAFDRWAEGIIHWEQSLVQLLDDRLLAVAWSLDGQTGEVHPTPYAIAPDAEAFTVRGLTGFLAQTAKLVVLPDGRILCAYRRHDRAGLWATLARLEGERWVNLETIPLWEGATSGMTGTAGPGAELIALSFGYPQMAALPDGTVFLVFWCEEDGIATIRWLRLQV